MTIRRVSLPAFAFALMAAAGVQAQTTGQSTGQSTGKPAAASPPQPAEQVNAPRDFQALDTDRDGVITQDEFRKYRVKRFRGLDRDKDGWVTPEEFAPARYAAAQRLAGANQTAQRPVVRDAIFISLDHNSDGRLSEEEFVAAGMDAFNEVDADKDGNITAAEWEQGPRAVRGKLLR